MDIKTAIESGNGARVDIDKSTHVEASKICDGLYSVDYYKEGKLITGTIPKTLDECIKAMEDIAPIHEWKAKG